MTKNDLTLTNVPTTKVGMGIRRPPAEVFQAFADPAVTTRFWITKSSGKFEAGAVLTWQWEMYGASAEVRVLEVEADRRIKLQWDGGTGPRTVEFHFLPWGSGATYVEVTEQGFTGTGDQMIAGVADSTGGFAFVLSALKALLEHGVVLRVVLDAHPGDVKR